MVIPMAGPPSAVSPGSGNSLGLVGSCGIWLIVHAKFGGLATLACSEVVPRNVSNWHVECCATQLIGP